MVIEMCLTALLSGNIEYDGSKLDQLIDANNKVVYKMSGRTLYLLADKYNLVQLCDRGERFPVNVDDREKLNLVSTF